MEDTKIIKQHYAYMFRVDLSNNQNSKLQIEEWLDKFNFTHWHGCHEIGTETKKHHFQMVVWREHKYQQNQITQARNWWRNKTNSKTHGVALTSARKVSSLVSYSAKEIEENEKKGEINKIISNLSKEQLINIPKWESKTAVKLKNLEKMEKMIKKLGVHLGKNEFCKELNKIYFQIYGKPLMHRNTYIKYLYRYKYMDDAQILNLIFPFGIPGDESLIYEDDNYAKMQKQNAKVY